MATTLTNMGLRQWNAGSDPFSYTELAANWALVDTHDHTLGKGVQIPTGGLANLAVDSTKLADNAVSTIKLVDASVTNAKLAASAVTAAKVGVLPQAKIRRATGTQTISGATITAVTFDTETYDLGGTGLGMVDLATQATRITIQTPGLYMFSTNVAWPTTSISSGRGVGLRLNGTTIIAWQFVQVTTVANSERIGLSWPIRLAAADYIETIVFQDSGGTVNIGADTAIDSPGLACHFVSA